MKLNEGTKNMSYHSFSADLKANWDPVEFDINESKGIYVQVKAYLPIIDDHSILKFIKGKQGFHTLIENIYKLEDDLDIYGFRREVPKDVLDSPDFMSLDEYVLKKLQEFNQNPEFIKIAYLWDGYKASDDGVPGHGCGDYMTKLFKMMNEQGEKLHKMPAYIKKIQKDIQFIADNRKKMEGEVLDLYHFYQRMQNASCIGSQPRLHDLLADKNIKDKKYDLTTSMDLHETWVKKTYPLILRRSSYWNDRSTDVKLDDVNYVNGINALIRSKKLIDSKTK
jgi:hypothetical protein